jgi:hypothetical protein
MNDLTEALPLSAAEKGITRNASRTLIALAASVKASIGTTITTPAALIEFWRSHSMWSARNFAACNAVSGVMAAASAAPDGAKGAPAGPKHGIAHARRTKAAPAKTVAVSRAKPAKAKTRGAGG